MPNNKSFSNTKTAVVLLNMGGPQCNEEVLPYLQELFQDRELLKLPFQKILGNFIAWRRTPKIQERYAEIGSFSPTLKIIEKQCEEISRKLDEHSTKIRRNSTKIRQKDTPTSDNKASIISHLNTLNNLSGR